MAEYIERETLINVLEGEIEDCGYADASNKPIAYGTILGLKSALSYAKTLPTADVVSRETFEQVKWERDTALKTLEEHGIGLAQKADKVEVVRCKDCKSYNKRYGECTLYGAHLGENGFCSSGIRKEGAEE